MTTPVLSHIGPFEIHASEAFRYSNLLHYSPYLPPTSLKGQKRTRKISGIISWLLCLMSCVGLGKFLNFIEPPRAFSSKTGDSVSCQGSPSFPPVQGPLHQVTWRDRGVQTSGITSPNSIGECGLHYSAQLSDCSATWHHRDQISQLKTM